MEIAVLGAGAFGTAIAKLLEKNQHRVTLWCRGEAAARRIDEQRESPYLPGVKLGELVRVTHDLAVAVTKKPMVVGVTPSHVVREVWAQAAAHLDMGAVVVNASKGIEDETLLTIDGIYRQVLPKACAERSAFLSGPTFAQELARGLPGCIVVASHSPASASLVQAEFSSDTFRVYTSDDVVGVELGGAMKNVCAIGAGIADGLGYGNNPRAALITRGLAEIARLGAKLGADPLTFSGLAGLGDLVITCTGEGPSSSARLMFDPVTITFCAASVLISSCAKASCDVALKMPNPAITLPENKLRRVRLINFSFIFCLSLFRFCFIQITLGSKIIIC